MSHIHIVEPYHSEAMRKMANPLMEMTRFEKITTGEAIDPEADLNFHIPWHSLTDIGPTMSKQGILYTHCNPGAQGALLKICERADFIVAMSKTGATELLNLGVDTEKITVIYAGHTNYSARRRNIGIMGYEQPNGRKRGHILIDLCWLMDVSAFHFIFAGSGWDDTITKMTNAGAAVSNVGNVEPEKLQDVYNALDLLLVTSYVEGGPLTVLEALGAGIPVIAPPVGYAADLLPDDCIYHSVEELQNSLHRFLMPAIARQKQVENYTWKAYAERHAELFEKVLCQSISTQTIAGI